MTTLTLTTNSNKGAGEMPTNHDETLRERYAREHEIELATLAKMKPEQIHEMSLELHNALAERDTLRQQLADSDAALRESRANDTAAMGQLADMRQQRDRLAKILLDLVPGCKWRIMRPRIDAALAEANK